MFDTRPQNKEEKNRSKESRKRHEKKKKKKDKILVHCINFMSFPVVFKLVVRVR